MSQTNLSAKVTVNGKRQGRSQHVVITENHRDSIEIIVRNDEGLMAEITITPHSTIVIDSTPNTKIINQTL